MTAEALKKNTSLTTLGLGGDVTIGDEGSAIGVQYCIDWIGHTL